MSEEKLSLFWVYAALATIYVYTIFAHTSEVKKMDEIMEVIEANK